LKKKIAVGPAGRAGLRVLARLKFLRGTPVDPFGRTRVRRVERALARYFTQWVEDIAESLTVDGYALATEAAEAALLVKGYEGIKLASVERYRDRLNALGISAPELP
jgi:indolepyruvate ferredoxin oxidoreductase